MIDQNSIPSRQLRTVAHVTRWILGLVAAFWLLLLALGIILHGFIVPRIGEWRGHVERLATQLVGAPVEIGEIAARSEGLFPTIELRQLTVFDPQAQPALSLPRVVATLSARSFLRLGLEQLYIEAPVLDIQRLHDGSWQVAGFEIATSTHTEADNPALQWLLDQPELVVRQGTVHFTDAQHDIAPQSFQQVDVLLRRHAWQHSMRLDAVPSATPQAHLQAMGVFRLPLLPSSQPQWHRWTGQWYAQTQLQQLPTLPWPDAWGIAAAQGTGAARIWADVTRGKLTTFTTDLALDAAQIQWRPSEIATFAVQKLQGRIVVQPGARDWQISGQHFSFIDAQSHQHWPSSNWRLALSRSSERLQHTRLDWDYADVGMASAVVQALPLPAALREPLQQLQPRGTLRDVELQWGAGHYTAKGRISDLTLQPQAQALRVGRPGVQGLSGTFALSEQGGQAQLTLQQGGLSFPGVFEEPDIPIDHLQAQLRWQVHDGHWQLQVPHATFSNQDAQGTLSASWAMGAQPDNRLPGTLNLQGRLERAKGTSVHRYLPLEIPALARHYVRDSIQQGDAENVRFEVQGDLQHMPFADAGTGRFYIEAPLRNVTYDFLPGSLRQPSEPSWPVLRRLAGRLIFEGASMQVRDASTGFAGHPQLHIADLQAHIADLSAPHVAIHASSQGRLQPMLDLVRQSPLQAITQQAFNAAQAQGNASLQLQLDLPIDAMHNARVQGNVGLRDAVLQWNASAPTLHKLQGQVHFSEQGFHLQHVHAHALGGEVSLSGGMASPTAGVHLVVRGTATAEGLRDAEHVPAVAQVARFAQGQASYTVHIDSQDEEQAIAVRSDLRGMALHLPAPLDKTAEQSLLLSVVQRWQDGGQQELRVEAANRGHVTYWQDASAEATPTIHGRIVVGAPPWPNASGSASGVSAWVQLPQLDVDAWLSLLSALPERQASLSTAARAYLPQRVSFDVQSLQLQQRPMGSLRGHLELADHRWQGQWQGPHFGGHVEYQLPSLRHASGRVLARLSHLSLPQAQAQVQVQPMPGTPQPHTLERLPALDIQVDAFTIADKALGRLHLQAHNRTSTHGPEWVLEQFDLTTPEARWKAHGVWGSPGPNQPRSSQLGFLLEIDNTGQLLARLGMPHVIRNGEGTITGQLGWQGSPITPHWRSMEGALHMEVGKGQFLKVEPGMGKLLSVLSLQSLTRRIHLDFRDVFSQGFAFDFVRGDITVTQGLARTNNLQMKGLNAAVLMEGEASLHEETQDLRVVVVPEINAMTASLVATAINPVVGLGSFFAQMLFRAPLMDAATRTFHVHGPWTDPMVQPVRRPASAAADASKGPP